MSAPTPEQLKQRAEEAANLWTSKNLDGIFEKYHDDLKYTDTGLGVSAISKTALRSILDRLFSSVEDFKMEAISLNMAVAGTTVTVCTEYKSTGKYIKDVPELGVKATGQKITCVGGTFSTMAPGSDQVKKIHHYSKYYYGDEKVPELE